MKQLTLLRHAKSSWDDDSLADLERPLAKRGLRDAPRMGERLFHRGLHPDLILTSPARRAQQTAELVLPAFVGSPPELKIDAHIYLASPGELLEILRSVDDAIGALVLVGHNPGLTYLANMMLSDLRLANLPTAGAVAMNCETDSWSQLDSAALSLRFYDYPKNPEPVG